MQTRYVETGNTITANDIQLINKSFHKPSLLNGGELSKDGQKLIIGPSTVLLPNGIVIDETENREISFLKEEWKTVYYQYTNKNLLGGSPAELQCIEGVYSQEELVLTDEGTNEISVVVAWVNFDPNVGLKFVKPNNYLYPQFDMKKEDFVYNKIYAKDLINYVYSEDSNINELVKYVPEYGHIRINGKEESNVINFLRNEKPIIFKIPFSVEQLGCFIIERQADIGAELKFTFESLEGTMYSTAVSEVLKGDFESKGTYITTGDSVDIYSNFESNTTLKNIQNEPQFFRVTIKPREKFLGDNYNNYSNLPKYGVLNITICPFDSVNSTGSDGIQLIRSVGFSKYNVPQIRNF